VKPRQGKSKKVKVKRKKGEELRGTAVSEICLLSFAFLLLPFYLEGMVARDGIEPPTPAFSGPRSTN